MYKLFSLFLLLSTHLFSQPLMERLSQANQFMPASGKYANQYIENSYARTPIWLNVEEKRSLNLDTYKTYFANFFYKSQFYIVEVLGNTLKADSHHISRSFSKSESVFLIKERWAIEQRPELREFEAHTSIAIDFNQGSGLQLIYNQSDYSKMLSPEEQLEINDIVISFETIKSQDEPNAEFLPSGLFYNYAGGFRVYSDEERVGRKNKNILNYEDTFYELDDQYILKTTVPYVSDIGTALLYNVVTKATGESNRQQTYNAFIYNCTNQLLDLLDITLVYAVSKVRQTQDLVYFLGQDLEKERKNVASFLSDVFLSRIFYMYDLNESEKRYLKNLALQYHQILNTDNLLTKVILRNKENEQDIKKTFYSIPSFFESHLKVRKIIKSSRDYRYGFDSNGNVVYIPQ